MTDKEKLEKFKKLADAMYYAANYLTTDASRLHKAMDEYHKFIIHECKEEPKDKCKGCNNVKGCITCLDGSEYAHIEECDITGIKSEEVIAKLEESVEDSELIKEEPVSEELEETSKNYALNNTPWDDCKDEIQESFKAGANWQKEKDESTTEDLGEYINELSKQFPEVSFAKLSRIAVRVAKWQKEQDQSTIELAEDHAYFAGRTKTIEEIEEKLLSVVLPCFMHGGEADEVMAKLDEVLNRKK